jgi:hypothetical protein
LKVLENCREKDAESQVAFSRAGLPPRDAVANFVKREDVWCQTASLSSIADDVAAHFESS